MALGPIRVAAVQLGSRTTLAADLLSDRGHDVTVYAAAERFLTRMPSRQPDVLVVSRRRADRSLVAAVATIVSHESELAVVAICDRIGANEARSLLAAGVGGLVISAEAPRTLLATIQAVRAGQVCVPRRQARHVERPSLSRREKQVIGMVALGFSNSVIADRLFLAESTVKSHLSSAFGKLGVRSRQEAVDLIIDPAFGLANGIMSLGAEPIEPIEPPSEASSDRTVRD